MAEEATHSTRERPTLFKGTTLPQNLMAMLPKSMVRVTDVLLLFTMNLVARDHSCCYLQGFYIIERIFAAIYNDFEHCRAFLLLFTMVYGTRVCFCIVFTMLFTYFQSHDATCANGVRFTI